MLVKVCALDELEDPDVKVFEAEGTEGIVIKSEGELYACQRYCSHEVFPLEFGLTEGHILLCSYHHYEFDLRSGEAVLPPGEKGLEIYPVHVENGDVMVELPDPK